MRRWLMCLPVALLTAALAGCEAESPPTSSRGFAGLGSEAEGFRQAAPGTPLRFPEDHGPHPDFRIEWWYLTANLEDETGESLGVQWTLFRQAQQPPAERPDAPGPWAAEQLWMAHMAVSRGDTHRVAERFARSDSQASDPERDQAGVTASPFRAWLDDWTLSSHASRSGGDALDSLTLSALAGQDEAHFGYRLDLEALGPLVLHGKQGFSEKGTDDQQPIYISQPFYRVSGDVFLEGQTFRVKGSAWLDREWGNQLTAPWHIGWHWFSLHLLDNHKLMIYHLRSKKPEGESLFGTWITPEGETTTLNNDELALTTLATSTVTGRDVPTRWRLEVPSQNLDLEVEAPHANRWMDTSVPYWEGQVIARDRETGETLGEGYLEMTGY
ncbi:MAG: lipocalin-like domain-containing protein [Pseudomonadota bacterium]